MSQVFFYANRLAFYPWTSTSTIAITITITITFTITIKGISYYTTGSSV